MERNLGTRQFADLEALKVQLRELSLRQTATEETVTAMDRSAQSETIDVVPPLVNFLDNSDFLFSDEAYDILPYTDDDKVLYGWFARSQASVDAWDDPTSSIGANDSITTLTYPASGSYPSINCYWDTTAGQLMLTGGTRVASRLPLKRGYAGNYMAVRMQICARNRPSLSLVPADITSSSGLLITSTGHPYPTGTKVQLSNTGGALPTGISANTNYWVVRISADTFKLATSLANALAGTPVIAYTDAGSGTHTVSPVFIPPAETMKMKVSLWDNDVAEIIDGDLIPTTTAKAGAHAGGTVTRNYILEIHMPDGSRHYSNTSSFTAGGNQATSTVSCSTSSTTNFVTLSWEAVTGATRYRVYRRTPLEPDSNWYLIGTTTSTSLRDTGGYYGTTWTPPYPTEKYKYKQLAETYYDDLGEILQTEDEIQEITLGFNMPHLITATMGKQYFQIELLNEDYTATAVDDFSCISLDRVGLSYTSGRWCPSPNDLTTQGTEIVVNPPPTGGGSGGNPTGGGWHNCVEKHTEVLLWNPPYHDQWIRAKDVVVGDLLLSYDTSSGDLSPTKVRRVIDGLSTGNYILHMADGGSLTCTLSHCIIDKDNWAKGTSVRKLSVGDSINCLTPDFNLSTVEIEAVERLNTCLEVRTFNLDSKRRNFVTRGGEVGYFNHNLKTPFEDGPAI